MSTINLTIGSRFTRWTVIGNTTKTTKSRNVAPCRCDCGVEKTVRISRLIGGESKSCGCLRNDNLTTHGMTAKAIRRESHEYWIWNMIVQRCKNPRVKNWADYGGRGIDVCDSWLKFENFYADMGPRPGKGYSIDRVDNNAGYHKDNCKWATRTEQNSNKRNNRLLTAFGKTQHLAAWAREYKLLHCTIIYRLGRGWSTEDAIGIPVVKHKVYANASIA